MKNILTLFFSLFFSSFLLGQNCEPFFPMEEGVIMKIANFNEKGKQDSWVKHQVVEKKGNDENLELTVKSEIHDKKDELTHTAEYTVKCENGVFYMDMSKFFDQESMQAMGDLEMDVEGDFLKFPAHPKVGESLEDGKLVMKAVHAGMMAMTITVNIINRKVEKQESITTAAGTFECFQFSYDIKTDMGIALPTDNTTHVKEWYAKDVGIVRSETYRKNGKRMGYSELVEIIQ